MSAFASCLIIYFFTLVILCGQSVYRPKLINSKNGDHHDFPLGVLEATGRLKDGDKEILIMDVGKGGAAQKAGLLVGDRVVRIDGKLPKPFSKKTDTGLEGPQVLLGTSLNRNSSLSNPLLSLQVRRESQLMRLSFTLPPSQSFAFSSPSTCAKRKKFLADISNYLVKAQQKSGRWQPGVSGDADVFAGWYFWQIRIRPIFPPSGEESSL